MKRYWALIILVAGIIAFAIVKRSISPKPVVIGDLSEKSVKVYDTIKIIETPKKRHYKAKNIELNRADSAQLVSVYGIGQILQQRIIDYRNKLGGFHTKSQLKEVKGITDEVYQKIEMNFWVDTLVIRKIKINFATLQQMVEHPYFTESVSRRLLKAVKMKGGYSTLEELLEDNILLPKETNRLAPYISFSKTDLD